MSASLPQEINVVEMSAAGGPEVLVPGRRPLPKPSASQVLIEVAAAGVNGPDLMQRKGLYPAPKGASDLLGLEVSGRIATVGAEVSAWREGDEVCALTNGGGYADYVTVEATHCLPVPEGIALQDAAGLPETYFTIWSNIFMTAKLQKGERFLVHGGAGGIGTTAIQLGRAFGAQVFATDSPAGRCAICSELGATKVIDYEQEDFVEILRDAGGANVILDIVGGPYIARNIKAAAADARIVQLAFALGSKVEINLMPIMLKRLLYTGSTLRSRPDRQKADIAGQLKEHVWPLFGAGKLQAVTDQTMALSDAAKAHALMESAGHRGKILLLP